MLFSFTNLFFLSYNNSHYDSKNFLPQHRTIFKNSQPATFYVLFTFKKHCSVAKRCCYHCTLLIKVPGTFDLTFDLTVLFLMEKNY